jgi:hypothetical protein
MRGLGEYLLHAGAITEAKLDVARAQASRFGGNLLVALVEMGLADEQILVPLASKFLGVAAIELAHRRIDPRAVRLLDEGFCYRSLCVAYATDEKHAILVAMADPTDEETFGQLRERLQGNVRTFLAGPRDIQGALDRVFREGAERDPGLSLVDRMLDLGEEPPGLKADAAAPSVAPKTPEDFERLRREFDAYVERTDRFLHNLTMHLAKQGLLPSAEPATEPAPRRPTPVPPEPRTVTPGPPLPKRTMTPVPPAPRRTMTPVPPAPRRTMTPVPPAPRRVLTPVPPPAAKVEPAPPTVEVRMDAELPETSTAAVDPDAPGAAVYELPSGMISGTPSVDAPNAEAQSVDVDIEIDAPPGEAGDSEAALAAASSPRSRVVSSDGAQSRSVGGEIRSAPPADPTASSQVLTRIRKRVPNPVIVIDFGTTRSSVALLVEDRVEVMKLPEVVVLPLPGGEFDMPSVVGFRKDGSIALGQTARAMLATDPSSAIQSPKRLLGRRHDDPALQPHLADLAIKTGPGPNGEVVLHAAGRETTVIEACSHVMQLLKLVAQKNLGQEVREVVLTAPVSFSDDQHAALRRAAQIAGLEVLDVIYEPVAAALANRFDPAFKGLVAVYDFGGGTFDFTVVEVVKAGVRPVALGGDSWLGGDDIDLAIANAAANAFWRETGLELRSQLTVWQRLLVAAELAKRDLTLKTSTLLKLSDAARTAKGVCSLSLPISRAQFAEMCRDLIDRSLTTCQETLDAAKIKLAQLNAVYVSGGTCYIPAVQQAIAQYFGKVPKSAVPPERAVLVGAALRRALAD